MRRNTWALGLAALGVVGGTAATAIATNGAHLPHDAPALRSALEEGVGKSASALGAPVFVPLDVNWRQLKPEAKDVAAGYLEYGEEGRHTLRVFVGTADGPSGDRCADGPASLSLSCETSRTDDGILITTVYVFDLTTPGLPQLATDPQGALAKLDGDELRVERNSRLIRDDGTMTSATETLWGDAAKDFPANFALKEHELAQLASADALAW